jgi:hypothetical protein
MELISSQSGQSLQLVVLDEVRPLRGGVFLPDLSALIIQRYRFMGTPEKVPPGQPVKFHTGIFPGAPIPIEELGIYNDGIIITSTTTDDADVIMDDFLAWITEQYRLREPTTIIPRTYQSTIIVSLNGPLNRFINNFQKAGNLLSEAFGAPSPLSVTRLAVGPQPPGQYPFQTTWTIEARVAQPFVPNRYMSLAPLPTAAHVALLDELESIMGGK